jgi:DNA (cytosine-5)-methyltransferase 1
LQRILQNKYNFAIKLIAMEDVKFIDLFCGIGGFRQAMDDACRENDLIPNCVFSSDIDTAYQWSYKANFGELPFGDITKIDEKDIPDHDILYAGFPCQPFSIIGQMKGFEDTTYKMCA